MKRFSTRTITTGAVCVASAYVLGMIKLFHMPTGGSITPAAMLPLILYTLACGPLPGLAAGAVFGLLKLFLGGTVIHPLQLLMDYPLAYAAMALSAMTVLLPEKTGRLRLPIAVILGYFARWIMATVSGAVFFAEYAGEQNAWVYSMAYNVSYLGVECALAVALSFIPGVNRLVKMMKTR